MKHAGSTALKELEPVLKDLRKLHALTERKPGTSYRRSKAFLHFHEDAAGMFADVRFTEGGDFERFRVSTAAERKRFLALVRVGIK